EAVRDSRINLLRAFEVDVGIATAEQGLSDAIDVLAGSCSDAVAAIRARLPAADQSVQARGENNRLLDARVSMLDLTAQQRSDLLDAQRDRDRVLNHHRLRKNPLAVQAALGTYEDALVRILSQAQYTECDGFETSRSANLADVQADDEALCPELWGE
ncbi:MAG: hypothetical protein V3T70_02895, partial [Phycisphaerae bacterium]